MQQSIKEQIESLTALKTQLVRDQQYEAASYVNSAINALDISTRHPYQGVTKVVNLA